MNNWSEQKRDNATKEIKNYSDKWIYENPEPVICNHFGCGKTLTSQETLYGDRCIKHSIQSNPLKKPWDNPNFQIK